MIYTSKLSVAQGFWRRSNSGRWFEATKDTGIPGYGVRFVGYDWRVFDELSDALAFVTSQIQRQFA